MARPRYTYMELSSEDPQAFGKQLTKALSDAVEAGSEVVNVSMELVPGPRASGKGPEGMLRVAQILLRNDAGATSAVVPPAEPRMN